MADSICKSCSLARKACARDESHDYIGCCLRVITNMILNEDEICTKGELMEGWVDLLSHWDSTESSGIITNFQLVTKNCLECRYWEKK